jgi:DNA-binding beta-propeller fold protein YncE
MNSLPMLKRFKKNWEQLMQPDVCYDEFTGIASPIARKPDSLSPIALAVGHRSNDLYILGQEKSGECLLIYADEFGALPNPVPVGVASARMAIDRDSRTIYVATSDATLAWGNSVCVVCDATTPPQLVGVGVRPVALTVSKQHKKIYVASYDSADLTIIDSQTLKTITVSLSRPPISISADPLLDQIYVLHPGHLTAENESAGLTIIDGFSLQMDYVSLPGKPHQMVMDPLRKKLYISDTVDRNGIVFDVTARSFKTWPVGFLSAHLLINTWENRIYAHPAKEIDYITRFEPKSGKVQTIPLPFTANAIALNADSDELIAIGKRSEQANHFPHHKRITTFPAHEYGFITYHTKG